MIYISAGVWRPLYPMPYIVYIGGMEIVLPVTAEHCIEAATRRAHRDAVAEYFAADSREALLKGDLLARFAQAADFPRLRRESEAHLLAGREVRFVIYEDGAAVKHRLEVI